MIFSTFFCHFNQNIHTTFISQILKFVSLSFFLKPKLKYVEGFELMYAILM